jgi:hypothetical protein
MFLNIGKYTFRCQMLGGAKVFVNNVQWSDQMMQCCMQYTCPDKYNQT